MGKADDLTDDLLAQLRSLKPGDRLPSIRALAQARGISKNTVIEAYDRLVARGLIVARRGSGFHAAPRPDPPERTAAPPLLDQAVDSVSLLRAQLNQTFDLRVGDGRPPAAWTAATLPRRMPPALWHAVARDGEGYGSAMGDADLRARIAARHRLEGVAASADHVLTTFGANHALDLVIRRYLVPGATVLADDPGYYPLFAKLRLAGVAVEGVRRGDFGPDLDDLAQQVAQHRPSLFFTQSRGQNPTGTSMDARHAHGVLSIAQEAGMLVVDDDPFIDLPGMEGTRLASLDAFGRVISIGTYAKVLHAGLRAGYVLAAPQIARDLAEIKMLTVVNSSRITEMMVAQVMESGRFDRHLRRYAERMVAAKEAVLSSLAEMGMAPARPWGGGLYTWLHLPLGLDEAGLAQQASDRRIFLAHGQIFRLGRQGPPAMRLNLSRAADPRFFRFLRQALQEAA